MTLRDVATRDVLHELPEDRPADETVSGPEPVETTPELSTAVQDMLDEHYMAWLDMRLPALGGRTPREACRTASGRQKVAMLIRTMPDPGGPAPVRVPREAMLRELGLDGAAGPGSSKSQPSAPRPAAAGPLAAEPPSDPLPPRKAGRNEPCPCGSGKKYKKCCGRTAP